MNSNAGNARWHITDDCFACGACKEAAPGLIIIDEGAGVAKVALQPRNDQDERALQHAAALCPVVAIRRTLPKA